MIEEADARRNRRFAGAVEIDGNGNGRLVGLAGNAAGAACYGLGHKAFSLKSRWFLIRQIVKYPEAQGRKGRPFAIVARRLT
ncbi:hypothetical protein D3C87_2049590 [compost metagenome]